MPDPRCTSRAVHTHTPSECTKFPIHMSDRCECCSDADLPQTWCAARKSRWSTLYSPYGFIAHALVPTSHNAKNVEVRCLGRWWCCCVLVAHVRHSFQKEKQQQKPGIFCVIFVILHCNKQWGMQQSHGKFWQRKNNKCKSRNVPFLFCFWSVVMWR